MKLALVLLLLLHGVLHLLGFAKGFHLAALPQLQLPISRLGATAWLIAGALLIGAAGSLSFGATFWGMVALFGVAISQMLILGQFAAAKWGTLANVLILVPALLSSLDLRPTSLRSTFVRRTRELVQLAPPPSLALITQAELAHLPPPVQRYLERVGVVGKPRVRNFHLQGKIKMRRAPSEAWMDSTMDQYSSLTDLSRLFFMVSHKGPISFDVFHQFTDGQAHMQARVLGLVSVVDASGPELTQSETVTILNDLCLLAPSALLDPRLTWQPVDDARAKVWLEHAGHRVGAELHFNSNGELVNFVSHDRFQSDGQTHRLLPWSTPISSYQDRNGYHLVSSAEAQWEEPSGLWTYAEFSIEHIDYDVAP